MQLTENITISSWVTASAVPLLVAVVGAVVGALAVHQLTNLRDRRQYKSVREAVEIAAKLKDLPGIDPGVRRWWDSVVGEEIDRYEKRRLARPLEERLMAAALLVLPLLLWEVHDSWNERDIITNVAMVGLCVGAWVISVREVVFGPGRRKAANEALKREPTAEGPVDVSDVGRTAEPGGRAEEGRSRGRWAPQGSRADAGRVHKRLRGRPHEPSERSPEETTAGAE